MILEVIAVIAGLALLVWSADCFVDGASSVARIFKMSPLLIGMLIVGFGTSAPEMVVSATAAMNNNPGIALGNGYGSNIANIGLILGITAIISPIRVHSQVLKKELPFLTAATCVSIFLLLDWKLSRMDAIILLILFFSFMGWSFRIGMKNEPDSLASEVQASNDSDHPDSLKSSLLKLIGGLLILVLSSRLLVWGAVKVAARAGVNDLLIGLTVVAIGTSLPELASSLAAIRRKENDIAFGNVIGSNLFNTLLVVGIAGVITPFEITSDVLSRDMLTMGILTLSLFFFGYGFRGQGSINRLEATFLLSGYLIYMGFVIHKVLA